MRNGHLVLKYTHVYNIKHTGPRNLQKKGVRWDLYQNIYNNTSDQMLYIISLGKPGGLISLYMASIRQCAPFCYCARITKLYTRDTSETAVVGFYMHANRPTTCETSGENLSTQAVSFTLANGTAPVSVYFTPQVTEG